MGGYSDWHCAHTMVAKLTELTTQPLPGQYQHLVCRSCHVAGPSRKAMGDYRAELMGVGEGEGAYAMKGKQGGEKQLPSLGFIDASDKVAADSSSLGELQWVSWDLSNDAPPSDTGKRWTARYTMRSHLDAVTCVAFHPTEQLLVSGSEDRTLKIWNLQQQTRR